MPRDGLIYGRPFFFVLETRTCVHYWLLKAWLRCIFLDFGYAFQVDWNFCDAPLRGVYPGIHVYDSITEWDDFEPGISRIENIPPDMLTEFVADVPDEWLGKPHARI
jgi:hypothetical protein